MRRIGAGFAVLAGLAGTPALAHEGHQHLTPAAAPASESPFLAENEAAMAKMMEGMAVHPTGNIDRDFVAMMTPHHQGAMDMAVIYLRHGGNEQLRRLAQEIVVTQQQEIAAMQLALGLAPPPSAPAPTQALPFPRDRTDPVKHRLLATVCLGGSLLSAGAWAGQAPDRPVSHQDRVYAAEQFSNTVSVTDPASNTLLGVIRLGDPQPGNLSPLYHGQVLVHGMGFSPDHRTLAVVSIGSNSVTFIDTKMNAVKHTTYVGRAPHEAFFTPDGSEVWVTVRGEDYVSVLDANTYEEKTRIRVPAGPGMTIFSPDGAYGYVCSSFNPETVVIATGSHEIVGRVKQQSPFCPNIAATPDGTQVWMTLKDVGRTMVFNARPPFNILHTMETGPITNHVNFAHTARGSFA
ncbi:DUF305 domain-containing protein [Paeniroseomonas aquatica]|uniref:DUF305 domain-containing protein n=1 Tax=Paeniroseomonas aquatica TaxID=373043 RepID=A0ABT7ZZU1_9PROT|nr:DUF305 domain-containing protein [Paeniroseomonas aquatica]MDN3562983.1 DUF305 domain-containing protein [Paeniroseomonas aquatica]